MEVALFKEKDIYIAYSPALDLAGQGDNHEEAIDALKENIHMLSNGLILVVGGVS